MLQRQWTVSSFNLLKLLLAAAVVFDCELCERREREREREYVDCFVGKFDSYLTRLFLSLSLSLTDCDIERSARSPPPHLLMSPHNIIVEEAKRNENGKQAKIRAF